MQPKQHSLQQMKRLPNISKSLKMPHIMLFAKVKIFCTKQVVKQMQLTALTCLTKPLLLRRITVV